MVSLRKQMEQHLCCQCKHRNSEKVTVIFRFLPNIVGYPVGLTILTLVGIQPWPIKLHCQSCDNYFFASGIHH
ncbi:hypothetical protein [Shewanella sairae]|uniref:hypothetical protein n=1 Tax=Shewanella sairae TaxID=190310 RepID=UPI001C7EC98F|nr:hypothetical protein [Shewanella sairae]MCL1130177.1 hypothetical protein [Shewanella sairae]